MGFAQDYYWVDSEGNKHHGERVLPRDHDPMSERKPVPLDSSREPPRSRSCDAQRQAEERSAACYARCRSPSGSIANCGHCRRSIPDC